MSALENYETQRHSMIIRHALRLFAAATPITIVITYKFKIIIIICIYIQCLTVPNILSNYKPTDIIILIVICSLNCIQIVLFIFHAHIVYSYNINMHIHYTLYLLLVGKSNYYLTLIYRKRCKCSVTKIHCCDNIQ